VVAKEEIKELKETPKNETPPAPANGKTKVKGK
jgi:hypothetical protein